MLSVGATSENVLMLSDGSASLSASGDPPGTMNSMDGMDGAAGIAGNAGAATFDHVSENVGA